MQLTRSQVLLTLAITAIVLLVVAQVWRVLGHIDFAIAFSWRAAVEGVVLGLAIAGVSFLVYRLWPAYRECATEYMKLVLGPLGRFDWIWLGLLPGLSEELLFRGVALNGVGLLASSLLFGLLHMFELKQWPYAVWATAVGLALGSATLITGNLLVPLIAHVTVNWISCLLWWQELEQA